MFRILKVLCFSLPFFILVAIIVFNAQPTFAQHPNKGVTPTSTPSNPYPAPHSLNSDVVSGNDIVTEGTIYPYPMPNPEFFPLTTPTTSYTYHLYLPFLFKPPIVYNRASAVSWADQWAHSRHPCFPNYGTGSNCDDCTNYLSQVLYAGGLPTLFNPS
ncbi:MAG: amidase domain-containing protein, partial [Chloroflexota bacterium]